MRQARPTTSGPVEGSGAPGPRCAREERGRIIASTVLPPARLLRQGVAHVVGQITLAGGRRARCRVRRVRPGRHRGAARPRARVTDLRELAATASGPAGGGLPPVNRTSRPAVVDFFNSVYSAALAVPTGWTGSVAGCNAGTTSAAYTSATLDMVNYFRAMTGLPASVTHEAVKDGKSSRRR